MSIPVHRLSKKRREGFTLIELLVVIAIIATLAVLVFVALNPVRRFREARNATRFTDVNTILTAVHEFIVDADGALPNQLDTELGEPIGVNPDYIYGLGTGATCDMGLGSTVECNHSVLGNLGVGLTAWSTQCVDLLDIGSSTPLNQYLARMPEDPAEEFDETLTGYAIKVDGFGLITVYNCGSEDPDAGGTVEVAPDIEVSR